jgi:hypothetical protein
MQMDDEGPVILADGNHLSDRGKTVYKEMRDASKDLKKIKDKSSVYNTVTEVQERLYTASVIFASMAYEDALAICNDDKCEKKLDKTQKNFNKAAKEYAKGHYEHAIDSLRKVWEDVYKTGLILPKEFYAETVKNDLPAEFALEQNYPNPFNPATEIRYQIPEAGHVQIRVYDILGKVVATLVDEQKNAGIYNVFWDAGNLASGVYVYTMQAGSFVQTKKLILMK